MESNNMSLPVLRKKQFEMPLTAHMEKLHLEYDPILPTGKILSLYQTIKSSFTDKTCPIVQFASAYKSEGAHLTAFETAYGAATQIGLRVLFIDTNSAFREQRHPAPLHVDTTLDVALQNGGRLESSLVLVQNTQFTYTRLRNPNHKDATLAQMESFQELLTMLRSAYDLIVIPSPAVLSDILCASLAKLADGTIIVIEAERTRAPVALQARETITQHGGKVIGAIMNKRRYYIPRLMYRWI